MTKRRKRAPRMRLVRFLVTKLEKAVLAREAKRLGLSVSELVRVRCNAAIEQSKRDARHLRNGRLEAELDEQLRGLP